MKRIKPARTGPPRHEPDVNRWSEVVAEWRRLSGESITRQRAQQLCKNAVRKLRLGLMADPVILEWLDDQGLNVEESDEPTERTR